MNKASEADDVFHSISLILRAREKLDAVGRFSASAHLTYVLDLLADAASTVGTDAAGCSADGTVQALDLAHSEGGISAVERIAACRCGQMQVACGGEPVRVSVCHCYDCQRRSGSAFAVQARFHAHLVQSSGRYAEWTCTSESGTRTTYRFCPGCGSTIAFASERTPDMVMIPVGAFASFALPPPSISMFEERRHSWVTVAADSLEHFD